MSLDQWRKLAMSSQPPENSRFKKACPRCGRGFVDDVSVCPDDGSLLELIGQDPLIGAVFGDRYEIIARIGQGGMGTVFKARHRFMDRSVAIKTVHSDLISDPRNMQRFQQEARAASALSHVNIVTVYDFGLSSANVPFLVMDYLQGDSLGDLIEQRGFVEAQRAIPIFIQICRALAHAHKRGILHRDLKPSNIIVIQTDEAKDVVKLVDFGIAKLLPRPERVLPRLTQTGEVFGSPYYMSPEQCMGQALDARSDIYSLGCLMYETLSGKPPIRGPNILATVFAHVNEAPVSISSMNPDVYVPSQLERAILTTLAKDPASRYQSADELREHLERLLAPAVASGEQATAQSTDEQRDTAPQSFQDQFERMMLMSNSSRQRPESEQADKRQLEEQEKQHGIDSPKLVPLLNEMIDWYKGRDLYSEALPLCARVIDILRKAYGPNSFEVALALVNKGSMRFWNKEYLEAETAYKEAIETLENLLGSKSHHLIWPLQCLADSYERRSLFAECELSHFRAIDIAENAYGPEHVDVANALSMLATSYFFQDLPDKAISLEERALAIRRKIFGDDHEDIARSLRSLGACKRSQMKYEEAASLYSRAAEIARQVYGDEHLETAQALRDLGSIRECQELYMEAEYLYKGALSIREKLLNPRHTEVSYALEDLAGLYALKLRCNEAEPLYKRSLAIKEANLGPKHIETIGTKRRLGILYHAWGRYEDAEKLYKEVAALEEETEGPWSDSLAWVLQNLGDLYCDQSKLPASEQEYRKALLIKERVWGMADPRLVDILKQLALVCREQGKTLEADELERRARKISPD